MIGLQTTGAGIPVQGLDVLGIPGAIDLLALRRRLGRKRWSPPEVRPDGGKFRRTDLRRTLIVSATTYPDDPDRHVWLHASIAAHGPGDIHGPSQMELPSYEDLVEIHRAVWPDGGWAFQVFAPPAEHVDLAQVLHLWGRFDGTRVHPDFAWLGGI
jgi:hypothetical protein